MEIKINGNPKSITVETRTVKDILLLEGFVLPIKGIAVAVNEKLVPQSEWQLTEIQEQDRVDILTAFQGG